MVQIKKKKRLRKGNLMNDYILYTDINKNLLIFSGSLNLNRAKDKLFVS